MSTRTRDRERRALGVLAILALVVGLLGAAPVQAQVDRAQDSQGVFWLTVLHNNDGESKLINAGAGLEDFGGVARFKTVVDRLRAEALSSGPRGSRGMAVRRGVLMLSSGDNFLAGPEFNASLQKGVPFYDSIAMDLIGYQAVTIGNHEFDFGPDVLADFIIGFESPVPFLSANLDFTGEPRLQDLVEVGRIAPSAVVEVSGERIGVVGATTPRLRFISSPRNVVVDPEVAQAVQAQVDALRSMGINKIILVSHLQSIFEDLELAPMLRGVDIMIAGGGDELLANPGNLLIPGDEGAIFGPYPLTVEDADGNTVYVVTTSGDYRYVGRLVVGFNRNGKIVQVEPRSGPVRVSGVGPDAAAPDPVVQELVVDPVIAAIAGLAANVIGKSEVDLDGRRSFVRTRETNEGNLVADSLLWQAQRLAPDFGVPEPMVALQNGGGIRNNNVIPAGDITELHTFQMLPFANFVSIVPDIPAQQFKELLENAVSRVEFEDGRFAQIAGFRMVWDPAGTPQELDDDGNVVTPGSRVRQVILDDGTPIVMGGVLVEGAPDLHVATIDFLARGGDQYPFRGADFATLGVTYQQALRNYIEDPAGLDGFIREVDYPEGGEGRITLS